MLINFALTSIVSKSKICKIPPDLPFPEGGMIPYLEKGEDFLKLRKHEED